MLRRLNRELTERQDLAQTHSATGIALFRQEQHLPSPVIDRNAPGSEPRSDAFTRARVRVNELVSMYQKPSLPEDVLRKFQSIVECEADRAGVGSRS